jgi:antirestriction protein ArdC
MNENVKSVLNTILEKFKDGSVPDAVAYATFPEMDVPSSNWSFFNRTIMFLCGGTADARGFRQWQEAKRYVKKGSRAFHILVPCFGKTKDKDTGEDTEVIRFFKAAPVFRVEDTEGEPLPYEQIELPPLPLIEKAIAWGINVKAVPGNYKYYDSYSMKRKEIALATTEECVFFHELGHAAHEKVIGELKGGQVPYQEIVAELTAAALCKMVGKTANETLGNSYRYIESYAKELNQSPYSACMKVLSQTEKVLALILKGEEPCPAQALE